jgi:hypothetical protein
MPPTHIAPSATSLRHCHVNSMIGVPTDNSLRMRKISYARHRFPSTIIQRAVWLYFRFPLSFRDVEEMLAERGIDVSYETIRRWILKFSPAIAANVRSRRVQPSGTWHLDEVFVRIGGKQTYLWMAYIYTPFMKKVLHITERKRETNVHHYCKSDDFRAGLKVAKWRMFCHSAWLQISPARFKQVYSDKA